MRKMGGRFRGLYELLSIWNSTDKQVQDNIRYLRFVLALNKIDLSRIKNIYVLGHSLAEVDFEYFNFLAGKQATLRNATTTEAELPPYGCFDDRFMRIQYEIERFGNGLANEMIDPALCAAMARHRHMDQITKELSFLGYAGKLCDETQKKLLLDTRDGSNIRNAKWHVSYYSEGDKQRVKEVLDRLGVQNYELCPSIKLLSSKLMV